MSYLALIGVALVAQLLLVSISFPLSELWTTTPLLFSDAGYHWYQMTLAKNFAESAATIGYDPFFGAGYAGGVNYNGSAKLPAAIAIALKPWVSAIVVYKF